MLSPGATSGASAVLLTVNVAAAAFCGEEKAMLNASAAVSAQHSLKRVRITFPEGW
jgi:hypothetical protein